MTEVYTITSSVWGGVTGSRSAPLKFTGHVCEFATREGAEEVASALTKRMNGPHAKAVFRYAVDDRPRPRGTFDGMVAGFREWLSQPAQANLVDIGGDAPEMLLELDDDAVAQRTYLAAFIKTWEANDL